MRDPYLNKIAVWTYYKGAMRDPGIDEGATTVAYVPEKGWFWYIPLPDDIVSVGMVAEKDYLYRDSRDLKTIFHREAAINKWIEQHLAVGEQIGAYRVTGEYSYRSRYCAGDGLMLIGDAFAFLDPVFSSGVFLALRSGEMGADAVDAALTAGDCSASRFHDYGEQLCKGIESMRRLVYTFYDHEFRFRTFLSRYPDLKGEMTDCLMGNLWLDFEPLFRAVAEFAGGSRRARRMASRAIEAWSRQRLSTPAKCGTSPAAQPSKRISSLSSIRSWPLYALAIVSIPPNFAPRDSTQPSPA